MDGGFVVLLYLGNAGAGSGGVGFSSLAATPARGKRGGTNSVLTHAA
jgi:hypothetical protein